MTKGKFLVFEGIDGSGKGTVIQEVEKHLTKKGVSYYSVKDPGLTKIGEDIRSVLLNPENIEMCRETELLLYIAARAQLASEIIKPNLENGTNIICDRYDLSTFTYQYVMGEWENMNSILNVSSILNGLPKPDWYFVLDVPVEVAKERLGSHLDRLEQKGDDVFNKIRSRYLQYVNDWNNISVIDASKNPEEVATTTIFEVNKILGLEK